MINKVFYPFVGDTVGGSHVSTCLLASHLDPDLYVPVIALHKTGILEEHLAKYGLSYTVNTGFPVYQSDAGRLRALSAILMGLPRMVRFLRNNGISIVHANDARMTVTWALASRLAGCKFVVHQRTRFAPSRIPEFMASLSHRIIAISHYCLSTLPFGLRAKATSIANPFSVEISDDVTIDDVRKRLGVADDEQLVVLVGTVCTQKRPLLFLEAAARIVRKSHKPVKFVMVGRDTTDLAARVKDKIAQLCLEEAVLMTGFRTDVQEIMMAADVVLAPAVNEGFGRVLVEAALVGTPVVAADSGGHQEIIEDGSTGLLVPVDDADALALGALKILNSSDLGQSLANAARARALSKWTVKSHTRNIQNLYGQLLNGESTRKADVVMVIESLGGGGAQHVLTSVANHWVESGLKVDVVTFQGQQHDAFKLSPEIRRFVIGHAVPSQGPLGGVLANIKRIASLRSALKRSGATLRVGFVGTTNILTVLASAGLGGTVVISERNDPTRQSLGHLWDALRRLCYPFADVVSANSRFALEGLARFVPDHKRVFLPNPLRKMNDANPYITSSPYVLAVGRLNVQKGFDVLLRAFATCIKGHRGMRLVIVGQGPEENRLKNLADELGIAEHVEWAGFVEDPSPYYRGADLFVQPSRYEGMPNAVLEAMSCGLPVVVTDTQPGALEFVTDGQSGLVVPADDIDALSSVISRLMTDREARARIGRGAKAKVAPLRPPEVYKAWDSLLPGDQDGTDKGDGVACQHNET